MLPVNTSSPDRTPAGRLASGKDNVCTTGQTNAQQLKEAQALNRDPSLG